MKRPKYFPTFTLFVQVLVVVVAMKLIEQHASGLAFWTRLP